MIWTKQRVHILQVYPFKWKHIIIIIIIIIIIVISRREKQKTRLNVGKKFY